MRIGPRTEVEYPITQPYWDGGVDDPRNPWRDAAGNPYNPYPWNGHGAIDEAVPEGTPLLSPISGVVKHWADFPSGPYAKAGYGYNVEIYGTGDWADWYCLIAHGARDALKGAFLVADDVLVEVGTPLMLSNSTGFSTAHHGHTSIRTKDKSRWTWPMGGWVDPLQDFGPAGTQVPIDRVLEMEALLQRALEQESQHAFVIRQIELELAAIRQRES